MTDDGTKKIAELVKDAGIAMFTTVDADHRLVSRPMGLQEVEFDGDLWFFADDRSDTVAEVSANPSVNVSFSTRGSWVSVTGDCEVVRDRDRAEQLWSSSVEAWFPDGPTTPGVVLLKVHAHAAQYWDVPGAKVVQLFSLVKAKVTGQRFEGGESGTVELD
ncbi:pyridoxamine 5'-phosphate oxidase [Georgenia wutianyii]|uniref:Pyridoxamine 5'-phosphate oxidase n=1 Tax=Georgenia wutianyii TaxID=2585135 RepID=A0ABX5VM86_9MICO|nr:pyridoxamine 5'-phosphate oxidase family protein [Georgenia wutianyii]QDB79617.1 pyridoxamine 5'-phosphate oxidase [Georgenia wutianyii]